MARSLILGTGFQNTGDCNMRRKREGQFLDSVGFCYLMVGGGGVGDLGWAAMSFHLDSFGCVCVRDSYRIDCIVTFLIITFIKSSGTLHISISTFPSQSQ